MQIICLLWKSAQYVLVKVNLLADLQKLMSVKHRLGGCGGVRQVETVQ